MHDPQPDTNTDAHEGEHTMPDDDSDFFGAHCDPFAIFDDADKLLAFHEHHPEGYGIDTYPERADAERESFVEHIADAFRTLVNDGTVKPDLETRVYVYQRNYRAACICYRVTIFTDESGNFHITKHHRFA
jgi:hypothetical protein